MRTKSILLVEDDRDDEALTLDALRTGGVGNPITVARDGAEALEYIFAEGAHAGRSPDLGPDLILLDLKLPKVSGLEVLRRIKTDDHTRVIPVVVLTSSSEQKDILKCYGNGANSYVRKPVDFESFVEAIRHVGVYWLQVSQSPVGLA